MSKLSLIEGEIISEVHKVHLTNRVVYKSNGIGKKCGLAPMVNMEIFYLYQVMSPEIKYNSIYKTNFKIELSLQQDGIAFINRG